jgi:hypothetical protein
MRGVKPCRLCISDFDGSSRRTLPETRIRHWVEKKGLNAPVNHYNFLSASHISERPRLMEQYHITSLSVNQPWGRNHALVCVGPGGIRNHEANPTAKVKQPSIRNKYRHPLKPPTPRRRNIPVARKALTMSVI